MRIAVLVKQTFTTEARIELDESGGIADKRIKKVINPYDEFAVEEAVQMREQGKAENVTVFTLGPEKAKETARQCLAMGADEAVVIDSTGIDLWDCSSVATVLAEAVRGAEFDLLLAGFTAVDDNSAQVAVRVAEILDIPQIDVASKVEVGEGEVTAWRETDGGTEVVTAQLPALITADKSLNEPRYPTLPNIMKAKKKPLAEKTLADLGIEVPAPKTKTVKTELPPPKQAARIFEGTPAEAAAQLARALREEAKVI